MNFIKIWMKEQGLLPRIRSRTTGHETGETNRSPRLEYARGTDDRLIDEGFVERRRDENDRRVVNVVLLPAGEEKLTSIRETIVRQVMRWTGTIPEKEFFELEHALQTISTVLESAQI